MFKAYKFRIYPTKEQEVSLSKTFGCVRFVYNKALDIKSSAYEKDKTNISINDLIKDIVNWKKEDNVWLKEANSQSLQMSLRNLDTAYTRFFEKKSDFPKFKKKHSRQSFCNVQGTKVDFGQGKVFVPKFKEGFKCVFHRQFSGKIKSSTISKTSSGKYFISILVKIDDLKITKVDFCEKNIVGIDLGIKHYATLSDGTKIENPKHFKKHQRKLRRIQRSVSRSKMGSKNRNKKKVRVSKCYEKITNSRKDFLNKLAKTLVENQDYAAFAIEDLDIKGMLASGNKRMARFISDAGWYMFNCLLKHKAGLVGKEVKVIGRFEPSSKLCTCGVKNEKLKLTDRIWCCDSCGTIHDRDVLAANNIKRFAICE